MLAMNRLLLIILVVACAKSEARKPPPANAAGNAERGRALIAQYGCTACHITPGVEGPQGMLGPDLTALALRPTISNGAVQNTPANLTRFIENPPSMNPATAMPSVGVTPADAQDMTAYLLTLR
jgi:cytochrome c2